MDAPGLPGHEWQPPDQPHPNGTGPDPFAAADLARLVRKPGKRPAVLADLIYGGKLHSVAGAPESGKTIICLHLMLAAMAKGHRVILFDHETGPDQIGDLLRAFGADPDMVADLMTYVPFPQTTWRDADVARMHDMAAALRPAIVGFDSFGEMLAANGAKEIDSGEVTRFANRVFMPLATDLNCGVIITDHDAKGGEQGGFSRYARGSTAKLGKVDVAIKLEAVKPFSRDSDGMLRLIVTKDRPGCLYRTWEVAVTRNPLSLSFTRTKPTGNGEMSPAKAGMLAALTDNPLTIKQLVDRFAHAVGHGLRRETASRMLNELLAEGLCDRLDQGNGVEALWSKPAGDTLDTVLPPEPPEDDGTGGWGPDSIAGADRLAGL
jgi:hypothetical protein